MRPRTAGCLLGTLGSLAVMTSDVMAGRWGGASWCALAAVGLAFHATHPPEWWDAIGHRVADRLGLRR